MIKKYYEREEREYHNPFDQISFEKGTQVESAEVTSCYVIEANPGT